MPVKSQRCRRPLRLKKKTDKTPIYKEIWFWLLAASVVLFAAGVLVAGDDAATGAPELAAAVRSMPAEAPDAVPNPSPAPGAEPETIPAQTEPTPKPTSEPTPKPEPTPVPGTTPMPKPEPLPETIPAPEPEPPPEPASAPTPEPTEDKTVPAQPEELSQHPYVGSAGSNKYHRPTCRYCNSIREDNLVYWDTIEEAEEAGYVACKVCKPN